MYTIGMDPNPTLCSIDGQCDILVWKRVFSEFGACQWPSRFQVKVYMRRYFNSRLGTPTVPYANIDVSRYHMVLGAYHSDHTPSHCGREKCMLHWAVQLISSGLITITYKTNFAIVTEAIISNICSPLYYVQRGYYMARLPNFPMESVVERWHPITALLHKTRSVCKN